MNNPLTSRATNIPNAGIVGMMNYASKYKDVISLGQGTPLFPTPQFIYDYVYERAKKEKGIGMYSEMPIENELKDHITKQMETLYGFVPDKNRLFITLGGVGALFAAMLTILEKDTEIIYFTPSYPIHLSQIHIAQATPVFAPLDEKNGWTLDMSALKKAVTPHTKAIVLTNPNNPTGTVLTEEEIKQMADLIIKHNLYLILDEAYEFLTYGKKVFSPMKLETLRDRIILCKSFSKEYAMTGWRIGYVYAPASLLESLSNIHINFTIKPPTISIAAAIAALSDPRGTQAMIDFKNKFTESRTAICERLDRLPQLFSYHKPDGAYYAFPRIVYPKITSALEFAKLLIDEAKVITIPGDSMGPSGKMHLRMSFAADPSVIHAAFDRIDKWVKTLLL